MLESVQLIPVSTTSFQGAQALETVKLAGTATVRILEAHTATANDSEAGFRRTQHIFLTAGAN